MNDKHEPHVSNRCSPLAVPPDSNMWKTRELPASKPEKAVDRTGRERASRT
jgi:hypothetical protein